jgi:hypothetical protein
MGCPELPVDQRSMRVSSQMRVATTLKESFVVSMRSIPGNPYDGHKLEEALTVLPSIVRPEQPEDQPSMQVYS